MASDFKYAAQTDLEMYYPAFSQYDVKRQIVGWSVLSTNKYIADNTGIVTQLFMDGADLATAQSSAGAVNSNFKWYYLAGDDRLYLYNDASNPIDMLMEAGIDNATYFNQMLVNASFKLNNMLDKRYSTPIPKHPLYDANNTTVSSVPEYDAIIIEATCYLCASALLRTENNQEEADYFQSLVTNQDGTGIVDKLNKGEYKLAYEVDSEDSKGQVKAGASNGGSMNVVETAGAYIGEAYDNIKIICTTTGVYGIARIKVQYFGNSKLLGAETSSFLVTGGLQEIHQGLYCRFHGASMTENDLWEVALYSDNREITNASSKAIDLTRRGFGL